MAYTQGPLALAPAFRRWAFMDFARAGRLPSAWRAAIDADPMLRNVAMVIDLSVGGRSVRLSTRPIRSVSGTTGLRYDALPLLIAEPPIASELTIGSASGQSRSVGLTMDAKLFAPMSVINGGQALCGIGEISLERNDIENDYDDRYVLLRGDVDNASFGAVRTGRAGEFDDHELLTLQLFDPRDSCAGRLPPWILDESRLTGLPPSGVGATYPIVLNSALRAPTTRITNAPTGSNQFVVAAGVVSVTVLSGNVFLNGVSALGGVNAWVAEQAFDNDGVQFTRIRFTNAAKVWAESDAVHVTSTALAADLQEDPIDVIRRVVETRSPIGVAGANAELFATASARYPAGLGKPRVVINASGGNAATVLDWIENGLLQSYPMISMLWAGGGYGPVITDSRAAPLASLVVGTHPILDRTSLVAESPGRDVINEIAIRYGYDPMLDSWAGVVVRGPTNSALCQASRLLYGQRDAPGIDSIYITDALTAAYVANWLVQHRALPSYSVEYEASAQTFFMFRPGDTVLLTDAEFGWVGERATIERIAYERARCTVTFRIWLRALDVGAGALSRPGGTT